MVLNMQIHPIDFFGIMKNMSNLIKLLICAALLSVGGSSAAQDPPRIKRGVMIHYLAEVEVAKSKLAEFNVEEVVKTIKSVGADYFVFTIGQNTGQYLIDSKALVDICPFYSPRLMGRDVGKELAAALSREGISLFLYLPFRAPQRDKALMECLGDNSERKPTTPQFMHAWSQMIREYSLRYGHQLAGWWFDGAYNLDGIDDKQWTEFCSATQIGSSFRYVALNPGEGVKYFSKKQSVCQNYSAGELNLVMSYDFDKADFNAEMSPHILTYLSSKWARRGLVNFDCRHLSTLTSDINRANGFITVDIAYGGLKGFDSDQVSALRSAWVNNCEQE